MWPRSRTRSATTSDYAHTVAFRDDLVGRDIELEAVARAIDQARAGGFHVVVISGEPGIGKTSMLAAGVALAQADALAVLRARAVTQERDVPFALAAALLDDRAAAARPGRPASRRCGACASATAAAR